MTPAVFGWLFLRGLRWILSIAFVVFSLYFLYDRAPHMNQFGQLVHSAEAVFFGTSIGAIIAGFLELAMREKAGLERPSFGELIPPKALPPDTQAGHGMR